MAGSLMLINPRKRRKSAKRSKNPVRALKRRHRGLKRRRNPIARAGGGIVSTLQSGAIGAAGAIGAKMVTSFLPIPDSLKSGAMAPLVNALIGAGVGMAVSKIASKSLGNQIGVGAVTVALYDAMRGALAGKLPGLSGDDYLEMDNLNAYDNLSAYDNLNGDAMAGDAMGGFEEEQGMM